MNVRYLLIGLSFTALVVNLTLIGSRASNTQQKWAELENQKLTLAQSADIQKSSARKSKEVADEFKRNKVSNPDALVQSGYTSDDSIPPAGPKYNNDWRLTKYNQVVQIQDQSGAVVGYAYKGQFYTPKEEHLRYAMVYPDGRKSIVYDPDAIENSYKKEL